MKKQILLGAFLFGSLLTVSAQSYTYDFTAMTEGNVGTDMTGETAGQNDWFTFGNNGVDPTTTTNVDSGTFMIVDNEGEHGNVLQVTGPNGDKGSAFMWKNGTGDWWTSRTAGNDILQVEFDFYTGSSTSMNNMRVVVYNADGTKVLTGLSIRMDTRVISGLANYNNAGTVNNYLFNLGTQEEPNVVLEENTWVRLGMSYNFSTGQVLWKGPGIDGGIMGAATGTAPGEIDFVVTSGSTTGTGAATNTASATGLFDNMMVEATATGSLLDTEAVAAVGTFAVYPNPTTGVINIANAENILVNNVEIIDINGRTVKTAKFDNVSEAQINISDLASGMYIMNISSDKGNTTKKIVKN